MNVLAKLPWWRMLGAVLLTILTFPRIDPDTGLGVDNALAWAFNHLFSTGLEQGAHIVFPHGPLAFILYPQALGGDLGAALFAICAVLLVYHFAMLTLGASTDRSQYLLHATLAGVLAPMLQTHLQLVAIVGCGLYLHWRERSYGWLAVALLASLIAVHIRAGVGVMTCSLLAVHAALLVWKRRDTRTVLIAFAAFIAGAIVLRVLLFGNLEGLGTYYIGLLELTRASSAAVGLHPTNDWWAIIASMVAFASVPLLARDRAVRYIFVLFIPALYAAWKHGITREDVEHARGLFVFVLMLFALVILIWREPRRGALAAMALSLMFGYRALHATEGYKEFAVLPFGVNRLHTWLFEREELAAQAIERSLQTLEQQRLPAELVQRLSQGTVDVYPWDYSYIPANDLKWQPRPVVQSYASYTPWLDEQNARFFRNKEGADRIIWHLGKDEWGGRMASVDGRYLLNDEPQALLAMLDNYTWIKGDHRVALLERSAPGKFGAARSIGSIQAQLNQWIPVPWNTAGVLLAKVHLRSTPWRPIADLLYKDAAYTVIYRTQGDSTYTYRFVPDVAREGLWVAPFIHHPEHDEPEAMVTAIRFECSEPGLVRNDLSLEWEFIPLKAPRSNAAGLFGKISYGTTLSTRLGFEAPAAHWQWNGQRTDSISHQGEHAYRVAPQAYSPAFEMGLDSISTPTTVQAHIWTLATSGGQGRFIIEVSDSSGTIYWEPVDVQASFFHPGEWRQAKLERTIPTGPGRTLKVYLWNTGLTPLFVDDLGVQLVQPLP